MSPRPKKTYQRGIIFNADDYGPMDFLNQGIEEGIRQELVNSVSAFATYGEPSMSKIAELQQKHGDDIGIGLHFTITAGKPVGSIRQVPSLYRTQRKRKQRFRRITGFNLRKAEAKEVEIELRLQIEHLAKRIGGIKNIDHINSHQGLLAIVPEYWEIALRVAQDYELPLRSAATYEMGHSYYTYDGRLLQLTKSAIVPGFITGIISLHTALKIRKGNKPEQRRSHQDLAELQQQPLPDYFIQSYYRQPHPNVIKKFLEDISDNEVGEFMLHLGMGNYQQEYQKYKHWGIREKSLTRREWELEVLIKFKEAIEKKMEDCNITKINYRDIIPKSQ